MQGGDPSPRTVPQIMKPLSLGPISPDAYFWSLTMESKREEKGTPSRVPAGLLQQARDNLRHASDRCRGPVGATNDITYCHSTECYSVTCPCATQHAPSQQAMEGPTAHVPKDAPRSRPTTGALPFLVNHPPVPSVRQTSKPSYLVPIARLRLRLAEESCTVASAKSPLREIR